MAVRDVRDRASEKFRSDDVILVTRDGAPAGYYLHWDTPELPVHAKGTDRDTLSFAQVAQARGLHAPRAKPSRRTPLTEL